MATVQSYTKTGVDNKVASRSNVTLTYSGTGTPELTAFPDAKTGDVIERSSDRAQWRVLGNTLVSLGHIVTKVNGQTGEVNITAAGLNASPTGHKHTIADITDLTVSTGATANHVVKRITGGNITVPTTPNANTSAASKSYVDSQVSTKANTSHTHTISQITDLTVSTAATANHVVKRITSGNITVPTTPNANSSAASKSYVDTEVGKKANTSHTHGISDVSGLQEALNSAGSSVHTHVSADVTDSVYGNSNASANRLVKTGTDGYLQAPITPTASSHSASKSYVDTEVGKKANTSHTHTKSQITDLETISTNATANHVVKRTTGGNITVPTTPNANTSAASKSYVDSQVSNTAGASHTHTKSDITDLETVSTGTTGNHIVKRNTDGNITVPATPAATTSATSKSYVDTEVGKKANTSHTHTKSQITDLETISTTATVNHVVKRTTSGNITVPTTPNANSSAASKSYVDTEVGKKANTSHTHTASQISDATTVGRNVLTASSHSAARSAIGVPVTDDGYNTHDVSDPASDYPAGVSYSMMNGNSYGWNNVIQEDTGYTNFASFVLVQTLRQGGYTQSTTQLVFAYNNNHNPVLMRKWYSGDWGPFRSLTDDGHTHTSEDITDATNWSGGELYAGRVLKLNLQGKVGIRPAPTSDDDLTNKLYVDTEVGKKANTSHTHTKSQITDLETISTTATANHVVKRTTGGNITVPTTPNANASAASKSYVDNRTPEIKVVTPAEYPETPTPGVLYFITY